MSCAYERYCRPSSVRLTVRVERDTSAQPSSSSSALMLWLTAGCDTPRLRAAVEKLRVAATSTKQASWKVFMFPRLRTSGPVITYTYQ